MEKDVSKFDEEFRRNYDWKDILKCKLSQRY